MIHLSCASIPEREASLKDWLLWARTQPVDRISIYLDRYESVPEWLSTCEDPRVRFGACAPAGDGPRLAVAGKFAWAHEPGVHVTTDDDLIYPGDYVAHTVAGLERIEDLVGGPAVVTYHGSIYKEVYRDHYSGGDRRSFSRLRGTVDRPVHQAGTGVMAFRSPGVDLRPERFDRTIGIDSVVAVMMKEDGVPIYTIKSPPSYWRPNPKADSTPAVYRSSQARDGSELDVRDLQTETVNAAAPWPSLYHVTNLTMANSTDSERVTMRVTTNSAYGLLRKGETYEINADTGERWVRYGLAFKVDAEPAGKAQKQSADMSAKDAVAHIRQGGDLSGFISKGEKRKTVLEAYAAAE